MRVPARVGIVGCGVISEHYAANAKAFDSFQVVACADLEPARAERLAADHRLAAAAVEELIADLSIDVVLNLTPPSAHAAVSGWALAAGKHVYSEKPIAATVAEAEELLDEAERLELRIGCAPDTFLGSAYEAARGLLEAGEIGEPLSVNAAMHVGGAEAWHPDPDTFYGDGAGPLLDMGPYYLTAIAALLGPVQRVAAFSSTRRPEREIATGPRAGELFRVTAPTQTTVAMELESGATGSLVTSFDAPGQYVCDLVVHGTAGVLALPDPNAFGGPVRIKHGRGRWREVRYRQGDPRDARGLGLDEMLEAIAADRPHRASGRLALHVLDVATSALRSAEEGRTLDVLRRYPVAAA